MLAPLVFPALGAPRWRGYNLAAERASGGKRRFMTRAVVCLISGCSIWVSSLNMESGRGYLQSAQVPRWT